MKENVTVDSVAQRLIPWIVAIAFFMQMLDSTILNTALPAIAQDLGEHPLQMQSVVIAYVLTVAVIIPLSGFLADRFGIKRIFLIAIVIFTLGSLTCALAHSLMQLIICRIAQGVGGALLVPTGRLFILRAYERSELVSVMSLITIPGLIGPLIGPVIGGLFVEYISWHWIFLVNVPVGILGMFLSMKYIPEIVISDNKRRFDSVGFILFALFMFCVTFGMESIGAKRFPIIWMALLIGVGLFALVFYFLHAKGKTQVLFPIALFRIQNFSIGLLGNLFARLGNGAMPFLMPLMLQVGMGLTPTQTGIAMVPMTVGAVVAKSVATRIVKRFGYRLILIVNTLLLSMMLAVFSMITHETNYYVMLGLFGIFGVINSTQFTAMNTVTLVDLDDEVAAAGNTLLTVVMQLCMSIAIAVAATLVTTFIDLNVIATSTEIMGAFSKTFWVLAAFAALSSLVFYRLKKHTGREE